MRKRSVGLLSVLAAALFALSAESQPPEGKQKGEKGQKGGRPGFRLGAVLPPFARGELDLTAEQEKQIAELEKEVQDRLTKILTAEQRKKLETPRPPRGPGGPGAPGGPPDDKGGPPEGKDRPGRRGRPDDKDQPGRPDRPKADPSDAPQGLVKNPRFTAAGADAKTPAHYTLTGDVAWAYAGKADEFTDWGVALHSGKDLDGDGARAGSVTQDASGFAGGVGRWFRFSVRGLAEKNFAVPDGGLFLKVDFFARGGASYLDGVTRAIDPLVGRDRTDLAANGNGRRDGGAVWKTYALEFRLPFAEIDRLRVGVGFRGGSAPTEADAAFHVTEFALVPIADPADAPKPVKTAKGYEPSLKSLLPLGGRWYYDPEPGMTEKPARLVVNHANAHRLYYLDGRLTNPFAENMTAWLRPGYKDIDGRIVQDDRFVPDNVVVEFTGGKAMTVRARNLPNHPTAQFPGRFGPGGRNPSYIQEHNYTYQIPLNPVPNPRAVAMDAANANRALPMGAIGIAVNGVVFYNPFDADMEDATDVMDRCCGHPSPDNRYHYHKYPVCVKSPFVDEGEEHSPLVGWAFDGFPIYGPYEAKGLMARDAADRPLNAFNVHFDELRGWHYHVTPGKFPYVIGGYWGEAAARTGPRRGPWPGRGE
jgi:hypothetical protein